MKAFSRWMVFGLLLTLASSMAEIHPLSKLMDFMGDSYASGRLPDGYSDAEVTGRPAVSGDLLRFLNKLEAQKKKDFKKFVMESEEYADLSENKRKAIAKDPKRALGVPFLVQIEKVYKIFRHGKRVGYVYRAADHVEAAMIQDGAGMDIYVDTNFKVIGTTEWTA